MFSQKDIVVRLGKRIIGLPVNNEQRDSRISIVNETLKPKASIPKQRFLRNDRVLFVHQGRGHLFINEEKISVRAGQTVWIPANAWYAVQNKGPKYLSIVWTVLPGGVEQYYQELAALGEDLEPEKVREIADRFGIEFAPEFEEKSETPEEEPAKDIPPTEETEEAVTVSVMPETEHLDPAKESAVEDDKPEIEVSEPGEKSDDQSEKKPASSKKKNSSKPSDKKNDGRGKSKKRSGGGKGHRDKVKEVYMDGRWVKVSGEGPVINMGKERKRSRRPRRKS